MGRRQTHPDDGDALDGNISFHLDSTDLLHRQAVFERVKVLSVDFNLKPDCVEGEKVELSEPAAVGGSLRSL